MAARAIDEMVQERRDSLGTLLPRLDETTWVVDEDRDGVLHDARCPVKENTTTRIHVRTLADLAAGVGYCPQCGPSMLTEKGGVGSMLLRLTGRLAQLAEAGRGSAAEQQPISAAEDVSTLALLALLDGSNRAIPHEEHRLLCDALFLPCLRRGRSCHEGALRVLTAGETRRGNRLPEEMLGAAVEVVRKGFLHHSPRGALLFYVADPAESGSRVKLPGTLLEARWDPAMMDAVETLSMFGDEALMGRVPWDDPCSWWETAKLL